MLVLDGAYTFTHDRARFHRAPAPSDAELVRLLDTLIVRITRTLVRAGVLVEDPEQPWLDLEPGSTLEHLAAAAVRYRIALGPMPKRKTLTLHNPGVVSGARESAKPLTAARDGFSLNAALACEDHQRDKGAAKHMAGIAPAILLHSRHPWRSDVRERPMRSIATTLSTANPPHQRPATASTPVNHCPPPP
jgi:hypothetical protein